MQAVPVFDQAFRVSDKVFPVSDYSSRLRSLTRRARSLTSRLRSLTRRTKHVQARYFTDIREQNETTGVLFYCKQGANRSGLMATMYTAALQGESVDDAYLQLWKLRPIVALDEAYQDSPTVAIEFARGWEANLYRLTMDWRLDCVGGDIPLVMSVEDWERFAWKEVEKMRAKKRRREQSRQALPVSDQGAKLPVSDQGGKRARMEPTQARGISCFLVQYSIRVFVCCLRFCLHRCRRACCHMTHWAHEGLAQKKSLGPPNVARVELPRGGHSFTCMGRVECGAKVCRFFRESFGMAQASVQGGLPAKSCSPILGGEATRENAYSIPPSAPTGASTGRG